MIKTFTLPEIGCIEIYDGKEEFKIAGFDELRIRGDEARGLLDEPYTTDAENFDRITRPLAPDGPIKKYIRERYGVKNVTNVSY